MNPLTRNDVTTRELTNRGDTSQHRLPQLLVRSGIALLLLAGGSVALSSTAAADQDGSSAGLHCPDKDHPSKIENAESAGDLVLPSGTVFCAKKQTGHTDKITADGIRSLYDYLKAAQISGAPGEGPSYYIVYSTPQVPDTTVPDTTVPDTTVPDTTVPDTTVPDTTVPDTTVPDTTVPEVVEALPPGSPIGTPQNPAAPVTPVTPAPTVTPDRPTTPAPTVGAEGPTTPVVESRTPPATTTTITTLPSTGTGTNVMAALATLLLAAGVGLRRFGRHGVVGV